MSKKLLDKSAKEILKEYRELRVKNDNLKKRNDFLKTRCKKLEKNLEIFSSPNATVGDFNSSEAQVII